MTPSRRTLLRGFLALPVAARLAPKPLPMWPVNGASLFVTNAETPVRTWAAYTFASSVTGGSPDELERALAKLDADPNLTHVDIPGGGVICRGI